MSNVELLRSVTGTARQIELHVIARIAFLDHVLDDPRVQSFLCAEDEPVRAFAARADGVAERLGLPDRSGLFFDLEAWNDDADASMVSDLGELLREGEVVTRTITLRQKNCWDDARAVAQAIKADWPWLCFELIQLRGLTQMAVMFGVEYTKHIGSPTPKIYVEPFTAIAGESRRQTIERWKEVSADVLSKLTGDCKPIPTTADEDRVRRDVEWFYRYYVGGETKYKLAKEYRQTLPKSAVQDQRSTISAGIERARKLLAYLPTMYFSDLVRPL